MSTQINVTVGSGGLPEKAKQQQQAARQAQLEKQRQQRIEAQGQQHRSAALAAEGRASDGSPLYGSSFKQPDIGRRPAANRQLFEHYVAEKGSTFVTQTRSGSIDLVFVRTNGNQYTFHLADTFAYPDTDNTTNAFGQFNPYNFADVQVTYDPPEAEFLADEDYWNPDAFASPPEPPPPPWGMSYSRTTTYTHAETFQDVDYWNLQLPLKRDAYILASIGKGERFRNETIVTYTENHSYVFFELDTNGNPVYYHNYTTDWTSDITQQSDSFNWVKCIYVNDQTCREISSPQILYELFKDYLEEPSASITWVYDTATNYIKGQNNGVYIIGPYADRLSFGVYSRSYFSGPYWFNRYRLWAFFATNDEENYAITTPGIYKALQISPTDPRFDFTNDAALTNVSYVVNEFYEGSYANLPKFGLQTRYIFIPEYAPKYYRHDRTKQRPTYNGNLTGADLAQLVESPKVRTINRQGLVWDWNNPAYCRQQLLALGFTEADLTP
jgi:hypothetical protein